MGWLEQLPHLCDWDTCVYTKHNIINTLNNNESEAISVAFELQTVESQFIEKHVD